MKNPKLRQLGLKVFKAVHASLKVRKQTAFFWGEEHRLLSARKQADQRIMTKENERCWKD